MAMVERMRLFQRKSEGFSGSMLAFLIRHLIISSLIVSHCANIFGPCLC